MIHLYRNKFHQDDNPLTIGEWLIVDQDSFNNFQLGHSKSKYNDTIIPPVTTSGDTSTNGVNGTITYAPPLELLNFQRGIKRDPNVFYKLQETKLCITQRTRTTAQTCSQHVRGILDLNYKPLDLKILSFFTPTNILLLTNKGKALERDYYSTGNEHQIYADLGTYVTVSTNASMGSSQLLKYITSTNLWDGTWEGATENFIIHWQEKIRQYDNFISPAITFSNPIKYITPKKCGQQHR